MNQFIERYKQLGEEIKPIKLKQSIRVNTLKISPEKLKERLCKLGVKLGKIQFLPNGFYVEQSRFSVGAIPEYLLGYYYVQEAAAQLPALVLDAKPGMIVADIASAPGGKTTQLAEIMQNKGTIIALDISIKRLDSLKNNLERLGTKNVIAYKKDARAITDFGIKFDRILLDAPCSGNFVTDEGWLKKRAVNDFSNREKLQKELLEAAIPALKPKGILVYSTCSLEPEENELVINAILDKYKNLSLEQVDTIGDPGLVEVFGEKLNQDISKCRRLWPHKTKTQGFFIAKIRKNE